MQRVTMEVRRIAGALGAEVLGIDLARTLDDDRVAALRDAWHEHLALFFRGQDLRPAQFMAFALRIGRWSIPS
jgi:taurine dioxygenase